MFDRLHFDRRLADGTAYRIRPSGPDDRELLTRCFDSLSPESRRMRFFNNKRYLSAEDLDRLSGVDGYDHIAFAAVQIDSAGRELEPLGFIRCIRLTPGGEVAEFSIVTVDRLQGQGIGSALLTYLIPAARRQGIRRFWFEVLAENTGMRRLAQRLGGSPRWVGDGILEYDCPLPQSTPSDADSLGSLRSKRPVVTALPLGRVPWTPVPGDWVEPWTKTWMASLDRYLAWTRAANEEVGHWLGRDDLPDGQPWCEAA
jgi:GNAT superfamily N-acetyltransferase